MQIPLQITAHGIPHSEALDILIRERVSSLERVHSKITRCVVTIDKPHRHKAQGEQFEVSVNLHVPGHPGAIVSGHQGEDVFAAVRNAFETARRQLVELSRIRHDQEKHG